MTHFYLHLNSANVTEVWLNTNYLDPPTFKSTTFVINLALKYLFEALMEDQDIIDTLTFDIDDYTLDLFKNWDNAFIGYNEGYLSLGMSVDFYDKVVKNGLQMMH